MRKPELLAPAGDMERLRMAVLYGADAVYLAGTSFGMRSFAGNFSPEELPEAVAFAHAHGVRVHVTVNTMPRGDELPALPAHLRLLNDSGVDALILADLGVFRMAQREAPNCELHVSTQVSIANAACAAAWHELGAKRVVLARELSLEEIRVIRRDTPPELELETFAHGAMCVSYSGRCLLSNYMTGRDSNRGACAQPCRYQYALMEEKRPGEYFPVFEDEKGTYMASDMEMYQFQTILHAFVSHEVQCFEQLTGRQSELTCIAAGVFPFAASRRSQLDTNTDIGFYVQLLRHLGYQLQLVQFFYHEEDAFSHLLRQQSKFNVAFILISVADNQRIGVHIDSNHCMQFRFGARFQSKIELLAMADNLLNHRTHLIHFNRIDDKVFRFITILLCRLPETTGNLFDPVVKDVGKADQHGSHHITQLQFVDQLFQINANSIFTRCYYNMTFVIDTKVRSAPTCNVVQLF